VAGYYPGLEGFRGLSTGAEIGSLARIWAVQDGDEGVGMEVGTTPPGPRQVPTLGPFPIITLRDILPARAGSLVSSPPS
jgi:hypothetical protein